MESSEAYKKVCAVCHVLRSEFGRRILDGIKYTYSFSDDYAKQHVWRYIAPEMTKIGIDYARDDYESMIGRIREIIATLIAAAGVSGNTMYITLANEFADDLSFNDLIEYDREEMPDMQELAGMLGAGAVYRRWVDIHEGVTA